MKFTVLLWAVFWFLTGCAEAPCGKAKAELDVKARAIDTCVSSGLCRPTIEDFEEAYASLDRVAYYCGKEGM
jgi:hypothetical protein